MSEVIALNDELIRGITIKICREVARDSWCKLIKCSKCPFNFNQTKNFKKWLYRI